MTGSAVLVVLGPAEHGVVIVARQLATDLVAYAAAGSATGAGPPTAPVRRLAAPNVDDLLETVDPFAALRSTSVAHVHFTDQLFGPTCAQAADAYGRFACWAGRAGADVSVTLHDLPSPDDDPARYERRRNAYARVVAATAGPVVVSSDHEAALLRTVAPGRRPVVIPLAIDPPQSCGPRPAADRDVVVLGFVYPGKGHAFALDALTGAAQDSGLDRLGLVALGRTADGHDDLTERLHRTAAGRGRRFSVTGYLSDAELTDRLRRAAVPLAAHERISASGSIATWLSAGRRPLVPDGPYTRELESRCRGAVTRYPPTTAGLRQALTHAVRDPGSTWLDRAVVLTPTRADVARRYHAVLSGPGPATTPPRP